MGLHRRQLRTAHEVTGGRGGGRSNHEVICARIDFIHSGCGVRGDRPGTGLPERLTAMLSAPCAASIGISARTDTARADDRNRRATKGADLGKELELTPRSSLDVCRQVTNSGQEKHECMLGHRRRKRTAAEVHVISVSFGITPESNQSSIPADGSCTHLTDAGNSDGKVSGEPAQIRASAVSIGLIRHRPEAPRCRAVHRGRGRSLRVERCQSP